MMRASLLISTALALSANVALAQDGEEGETDSDLDVTMTVIPEDVELSEAVILELEIPRDAEGEFRASEQGVINSASGLDTANAAREDGRSFGQETAAAAQENRESLGRESRPDLEDLLPDQVPNLPEIPDFPELPDGPEIPEGPELPELPDTPNGPPGD
jgi:hypothetical protein